MEALKRKNLVTGVSLTVYIIPTMGLLRYRYKGGLIIRTNRPRYSYKGSRYPYVSIDLVIQTIKDVRINQAEGFSYRYPLNLDPFVCKESSFCGCFRVSCNFYCLYKRFKKSDLDLKKVYHFLFGEINQDLTSSHQHIHLKVRRHNWLQRVSYNRYLHIKFFN